MENYDISKINLYSIRDLKRGELANIHSVLLFLYSKYSGNEEISFKYSEIDWLYYHSVFKIINKLNELNLISIVKRPTPHEPFLIKLKPNHELHFILNKDKRIEFHKFNYLNFNKNDLRAALGCSSLNEHFIQATVRTWIRNINNGSWDLVKFLVIVKIISYFKCDYKVKTFTVNKYNSKGSNFNKSVKFLYDKIPDSQKEIIYSQFYNTLIDLNVSHDKSFYGMINNYIKNCKMIGIPESSTENLVIM